MTIQKQFAVQAKSHGKTQLEIITQYPIQSTGTGQFILEAWFFLPTSLRIDEKNYGVSGFFSDINCLTRFGVPSISLSNLVDPSYEISPFSRIKEEIDNNLLPHDVNVKRVLYELRSLACIYASETKSTLYASIDESRDAVRETLKDVNLFLNTWREYHGFLQKPPIAPEIRDACSWTDESISLSTESFLSQLYNSVSDTDDSNSLREKIREMMSREISHRHTTTYCIDSSGTSASMLETRIDRESILKKWAQSALYLSQEESHTGRQFGHLIASIAAAIAMTFAVSVTIIADRYLPGQSLPWILAIVVSYIFKDRIKESLREVLIHTAPGLVADERIRLTDQATGNKAGRVNSRVRFIKARNAPRDVLRARQTITSPLQHIHPEEDLIHYRRKIVINNKRLRKFHIRLDTVTDIVRLKLDELLRSMDAPEKMVSVFAENEKPRAMKSKRVYSLSLVICLTGFGNQNHSTQRFRLVMSRDGLKRIESD